MFRTLEQIKEAKTTLAEMVADFESSTEVLVLLTLALEEEFGYYINRWNVQADAFQNEVAEAAVATDKNDTGKRAAKLAYFIEWKLDDFGHHKELTETAAIMRVGLDRIRSGEITPFDFLYWTLHGQSRRIEFVFDRQEWDPRSTSAGSNTLGRSVSKATVEAARAVNHALRDTVSSFKRLAAEADLDHTDAYLEVASYCRRVKNAMPYTGTSL